MPIFHPAQVVLIEGADALAFAHNQFTSPVSSLPDGQWQFSSWLDAQGRVRALFHLARISDERLLLVLRGGDARAFVANLQRFIFRSRVALSTKEGLNIARGDAMPLHAFASNADTFRFGCGTHAMHVGNQVGNDDSWQLAQLREGWTWLPEAALNELTPPALSLHRLGAVALDKGCYPGQEIVARLHYRGGNKKHLHHVELSNAVADGTLLMRDNREFIRLLDVVSQHERIEALAVIADDVVHELASHSEIHSDDGVAIILLNAWQD